MNEKGAIENEVAIVSGGLGYIGREIGCHLAQRGYKTVLLYLSPQEDMKAIRSSFKSANVYFYQCDITDSAKMKEVLDAIEEELGSISVGIHAAHSRLVRKNILDVDEVAFREQFSVGVFGGFNFLQQIALKMRPRKKGVLIGVTTAAIECDVSADTFLGLIASKTALVGGYLSSKFALKGLLTELAQSTAGLGIRVHTVAPGFVAGGLNDDLPPRLFEFLEEKSPTGQLTKVEDIAKSVIALIHPGESVKPFTVVIDELEG